MIRPGQVKALRSLLNSGRHFSSPLVVNKKKDGTMKTIDGNHRYEALKQMIFANKDFSINVWVAVYSDLTEEEEREVYREWNVGTKQSATDFLKSHWKSIPLRNRLLKELPVTIYGDKKNIPIKGFVGNQISAKKGKENFEGGYSGGIYDVVKDFQNLTDEDVDTLSEFSEFIERVLGKYEKKLVKYYTSTAIAAVYQIWYDNREIWSSVIDEGRTFHKTVQKGISEDVMISHFKKVLNPSDNLLVEASKSGGRAAAINFYRDILKRLNALTKKYQYYSSEDVYDLKQKAKMQKAKAQEIVDMVKKN